MRKLAPASISLEPSNHWELVPVNASTGLESGNSTIRDGDLVWIRAELTNDGDVVWNGNATLNSQILNITVDGQSSSTANFTIGPLDEGISSASIDLIEGISVVDSGSISITTGPPPLPRVVLTLSTNSTQIELAEQIKKEQEEFEQWKVILPP